MDDIRIYAFADEAGADIDSQIAAMKRNGLSGLEIRNVDGTNVSDITIEKAKEVKEKLDANGLITWSVGSPIGKISINDDFPAHLDKLKHTLDIADILKAKNIRIFSFYIPEGTAHKDCKEEVIDRMGAMLDVAHGTGIELCHENEKGIYGDTAERLLDLHKSFPALKGIFDCANFVQCGVDTLDAWEKLKSYIHYLHIKDSLYDGTVVPAGMGAGNVEKILRMYIEQGGRCVTMEPHLAVFEGLSELERKGEESNIGKYSYRSNDEAFDAACEAFKNIRSKIYE